MAHGWSGKSLLQLSYWLYCGKLQLPTCFEPFSKTRTKNPRLPKLAKVTEFKKAAKGHSARWAHTRRAVFG